MMFPHTTMNYNLRDRVVTCECGATFAYGNGDAPARWGFRCVNDMERYIGELCTERSSRHKAVADALDDRARELDARADRYTARAAEAADRDGYDVAYHRLTGMAEVMRLAARIVRGEE